MKVDLLNIDEFSKINNLSEVTSPILFQRGGIPHSEGLISNEIFGINPRDRKGTFAYIPLHGHYFHPHVYKAIKRMFRNIENIVNGEKYFKIDSDGRLIESEDGETGIDFLYKNWKKINWKKYDDADSDGMRAERERLLSGPLNEIFMDKQIVIPAFYRDIKTEDGNTGGETDNINNLYIRLIRLASTVKEQAMFDFQFNSTNYVIQNTIVEIYDHFKNKLEKKKGLIRKYLMGKNVDYCTRVVITAPSYHANTADDMFVSFQYTAVPMAQICSLIYPFILKWCKDFFEKEVIDKQHSLFTYGDNDTRSEDSIKLKNPEGYFSEKYIKKLIDSFIKDPESRFNPIQLPTANGEKKYLGLRGMKTDGYSTIEEAAIINRRMTVTDLLYMACEYCCKDKHIKITRYPILDEYSMAMSRIRVMSTSKTMPVSISGNIYKYYPVVEPGIETRLIGTLFNDALQLSHAYLKGLDGDYDGDQITATIFFSQEANEEVEKLMRTPSYYMTISGGNIRVISHEVIQTFYVLTKDPTKTSKEISNEDKQALLSLTKEDLTFAGLIKLIGNTTSVNDKLNINKRRFNINDIVTIRKEDYPILMKDTSVYRTTVGRFLFNKIMIENTGLHKIIGYNNSVINKGGLAGMEAIIVDNLLNRIIDTDYMVKFIDTRDWLGLQLHAVVCSSFTPTITKIPPEVTALKKKLLNEHKEAIANADTLVMENIEKQLLDKTKEILKDDIGMDLYNSGSRGEWGNHMKNMYICRGAVQNPTTKKYEMIENSLEDGLSKEDIYKNANVIVSGSYPKAVETSVSGYLFKKLLATYQTDVTGPKDSDCGSQKYLKVELDDSNINAFIYRYVKSDKGNGLLKITPENKASFIGKTWEFRSPMFCGTVGKDRAICNKCAGDFYYLMDKKNIGLITAKCGTTLTQMNMKKFHSNNVHSYEFKMDDILM